MQALDPAGLEALAQSLGGAKRAGDDWSCRCPMHDDREPSLSLGLGEDGRLLVHCHAGCDQREVFRAVLDRARELGLLPAPTASGRAKAAKAAMPAPRPKAADAAPAGARATKRRRTWPAHDARTGEHVADHIREDTASDKRIRWSKRGVRTAELALYRAEKLAEHPDRPAVVVEGEPAADALAELEDRLGVVALGTQTGAAGTPCDAALEPLRGRTVYLWPDADDPGRAHMSRIAARLRALGVEDVRLVDWPDAQPKADAADAVAQGVDIGALLASARPWAPEIAGEEDGEGAAADSSEEGERDADPRPKIRIDKWSFNEVARKVARLARGHLYMFGGRIPVVVQRIKAQVTRGKSLELGPGAIVVDAADPEIVAGIFDEIARFQKYDARSGGWVPTPCPPAFARRVALGPQIVRQALDHLLGISRVPLLRPDGTLFAGGYDAETEVYVDCPRLDGVPDKPTREDAERALETLLRPFRGYDLDRNAELRACIAGAATTAVLRPSIATSPAVLVDGNQPGTGKGLLARAFAALATGTATPIIIGEGHSPEELSKTVDAVLQHAPDVFILDNLTRPLECSRLDTFLSEGTASIRVMGTQKLVTVVPRIFVLITANNALIRTDTQRRMLAIRLVVLDERPELRRFDFDPVVEVLRDREELLRAAFTVLRWWLGELRRGAEWPELGSFREWSRLVAGAVRALTGVDLPALIAARRHDDPATAAERALFAALAERFGDRPFKAADAIAALPAELWADLGLRTGAEGKPDARTLTAWLRRRKDGVRGGYALTASTDRRGTHEWRIVRVTGAPNCRILPNSPTSGLGDVRGDRETVTCKERGYRNSAEFGNSAPPPAPHAPANGLSGNGNRSEAALVAALAALREGAFDRAREALNAAGADMSPVRLYEIAKLPADAQRVELEAALGGGG